MISKNNLFDHLNFLGMKRDGPLKIKSYTLAIKIVALYKYLTIEKKEFILSKQILRSGTNPGAMVREANNAESKADFIHKLKIAQKEVGETQYWIELLKDTSYISEKQYTEINSLTIEVMKMIRSSILTIKNSKRP